MNEAQQNKTYKKQIKSHRGQNKLTGFSGESKNSKQAALLEKMLSRIGTTPGWRAGRL